METPVRLNKFIAQSTGMSRRGADQAIAEGRVTINGEVTRQGRAVASTDHVTVDGQLVEPASTQTILLNKPVGYVVSRDGQGSPTIYELLPEKYQQLKAVGRLDKNSSGLLLLTNDGELAQQLSHPSYQKTKVYEVALGQDLAPLHRQMITDFGIQLEDGPSKLGLERIQEDNERAWRVTMREGRNRQIRRTFQSLGYDVIRLHRTHFGTFLLPHALKPGSTQAVEKTKKPS